VEGDWLILFCVLALIRMYLVFRSTFFVSKSLCLNTKNANVFFGEYLEPNKPSSFHLKNRKMRQDIRDPELINHLSTWLDLDLNPNAEGDDDVAALLVFPEDLQDDETIMCSPRAYVYKPVDRKVKPIPGVFPEDARVIRKFPEDPLKTLPTLPTKPPDFTPTTKISKERLDEIDINKEGFLTPEEEKLLIHMLVLNEKAIAFEETERGTFREDYFSPYKIPVIEHVPWAFKNIPIPPGIRDKVIALLKEKMEAGVYEQSHASYRARWFCVLKKNGNLRIVHDLQPLNGVTIREAGVPPFLDEFVEGFTSRVIFTVLDMYWGFHARMLEPSSRDLTSFMTPLGLLRITSLPIGFTNSPAEFQACMTFILRPEIPDVANVFIDDVPIKGPVTRYKDKDGTPEALSENPGIRRFVWEHINDLHRILHRIGHAGGTVSHKKMQLCKEEVVILGQKCNSEGRLPEDSKVAKILNWPPPRNVKEVRGFLGLCGTVRIWIKNYSEKARPLTELVRKNVEFLWDDRRHQAFEDLKLLISSAPALRAIDYRSNQPVTLAVDSSQIAAGIVLSQLDEQGRRRPARYGSLPMNERESRYSQPKLELFGLFRALRSFRAFLIGVQNLIVEVDAKYIKGMLNDPDMQPNATINRWIQGILLFDFKLIHIPATKHQGPDALSRRPIAEDDEVAEESDEWLDDIALYLGIGSVSPTPISIHSNERHKTYEASKLPSVALVKDSKLDESLKAIRRFLVDLEYPSFQTLQDSHRFVKKATRYYMEDGKMYKRNQPEAPQKVIFNPGTRKSIMTEAHEGYGHRGEQAIWETLHRRFYWPHMRKDITYHVKSCHTCQLRSTKKMHIPPTVSTPATIFTKIYVDVMKMPRSGKMEWIVAARDDLSGATECRAIQSNDAKALTSFFWEQIICRYGTIGTVVTDNGSSMESTFAILVEKYNIPQVRISAYNSQANGVVERGHFVIREALVKACEGDLTRWPKLLSHAVFADRITVRRATGLSPFYLLHGIHPVLPFDLTESTFLVRGFKTGMSSEELLTLRIRQLEKRPSDIRKAAELLAQSRYLSKQNFEQRFARRIQWEEFKEGSLVLVRNIHLEKTVSIARKTKDRYMGPYTVLRRTKGGAYVLEELDGTPLRTSIAAFRLIPYFLREDNEIIAPPHKTLQKAQKADRTKGVDPGDLISTSEEEETDDEI
jgi:hypothetical protein